MKALTYHGAKDVRLDSVEDPRIEAPNDILLRVTATAICGSDLHLYRGKVPALEKGDILGHEFMGIVEEAGAGVGNLRPGDRVVVPFVIACGRCFHCDLDEFSACESTNPGPGGALNAKGMRPPAGLFGYTSLYGGYPGGQAEYVRVPHADVGPIKVPDAIGDDQVLFLSDILPTAWQAVRNGNLQPGGSVAIFGAGPVGLLAAACCRMLGVQKIFLIDHHQYRLDFAIERYGVIGLNFDEVDDPAAEIVSRTGGRGVDATIDAVGFEAKGSVADTVMTSLKIEGASGFVLRQAIACTRRAGIISVPGVYTGFIHAFMFGDAFDKGLTFRMGQTHVQRYMPELLRMIGEGKLDPGEIITHRLPLSDAVRGYELFDGKQESCRKVVLTP